MAIISISCLPLAVSLTITMTSIVAINEDVTDRRAPITPAGSNRESGRTRIWGGQWERGE